MKPNWIPNKSPPPWAPQTLTQPLFLLDGPPAPCTRRPHPPILAIHLSSLLLSWTKYLPPGRLSPDLPLGFKLQHKHLQGTTRKRTGSWVLHDFEKKKDLKFKRERKKALLRSKGGTISFIDLRGIRCF
jgi:hypothetical protein